MDTLPTSAAETAAKAETDPAAAGAPAPAVTPKAAMIQPVHVDGALYIAMAMCASAVAGLSTEDAVKFVTPEIIFWAKFIFEVLGAGAGALKMYRSTSYSSSKNGNGNGNGVH